MAVISLKTVVDEGLVTLVPEPKSPHGSDVSPDGKFVIVGGKLDTHGSVYDFEKMKALIDAKKFAGKDPYGLPISGHEGIAACASRSRTRSATHPVRQQTLHCLHIALRRQPGGEMGLLRWQSPRQAGDPLQYWPSDDDGGRHDAPEGALSRRLEQARDRSVQSGWPAASAEPSANRHQRRQDGAAL